VHGAFADGALVGVVYLMRPDAAFPREAVAGFERSLEAACGAEGAARFARYNRAMEELRPVAACHVLALLGVRGELRGRGLGSELVRWVGARCDAHPRSQGVVLDTGRERDLVFYGRLGYRPVGTARLGPLVEHLLFRPRRPGPHDSTHRDER
jgi:GNAT superfamily N-acetyltransferase